MTYASPALIAPALALALSACAEWPRHAHLPDPGDPVQAADPRTLVPMEAWTEAVEGEDATLPALDGFTLAPLQGARVVGSLDGLGWRDAAPSRVVESSECDASTTLALPAPGDWIGDVDAVALSLDTPVQLCAELITGAEEVGWDLLLFATDECGLPASAFPSPDAPVGLGLGGAVGGWSEAVWPGEYQLVLAAYFPNDPERVVDYELRVSALPLAQDGVLGPCPLPPEEAR